MFCVGTKAITTLNPNNGEVTNQVKLLLCTFLYTLQWAYNEFVDITPSVKSNNEFVIHMRKGKKGNQMTFSSDYRLELITEALVIFYFTIITVLVKHSAFLHCMLMLESLKERR